MSTARPFTTATSTFADLYEQELVGRLFRPWAEILIQRVAPAPGERVLDIACGTGIVARLARERVGSQGRVVGVDLSPVMLGVARRIAPAIDFREGNATSLPVAETEVFDVVLCHQGLQFFPDRPAAARGMRRALAPGGRVAVGVWRSDEEMPILRELRRIAERRLGPVQDVRHGFPDPDALHQLLEDAGIRDVRVEAMVLPIRFPDGESFVRLNAGAMISMTEAGKAMSEEERAATVSAIVRDSAEVIARTSDPHGFVYQIGSNVATGRG